MTEAMTQEEETRGQLSKEDIRRMQSYYRTMTEMRQNGGPHNGAMHGGIEGTVSSIAGELDALRGVLITIGQPDPVIDTDTILPVMPISNEVRDIWLKRFQFNMDEIHQHAGFHQAAEMVTSNGQQKQLGLALMRASGENQTYIDVFRKMNMSDVILKAQLGEIASGK